MDEQKMEQDEKIASNEKWFGFYENLPAIATIILGIVFFIGGASVAVTGGAGAVLLMWLIGAIVCGLVYAGLKIIYSYHILHIYYLKEILKNQENKEEKRD